MPQIIVEDLVKTFHLAGRAPGLWGSVKGLLKRNVREVRALDGVSFSISLGELVGYIGPNGAGKSTTVKSPGRHSRSRFGPRLSDGANSMASTESTTCDGSASCSGNALNSGGTSPSSSPSICSAISTAIPPDRYRASRDELIEVLELQNLLDSAVRQLSLGQRMRCDLAAALLHEPQLLFLDEPTIGLDAVSKLAVREFIGRLNKQRNVTVILTTHDMDDIEALCRRVLVIGDGRILSDGTLADLRASVSSERWLTVHLAEGASTPHVTDPDAQLIRQEGRTFCFAFDPQRVSAPDLIARIAGNYAVHDLLVENPPIESHRRENLRSASRPRSKASRQRAAQ